MSRKYLSVLLASIAIVFYSLFISHAADTAEKASKQFLAIDALEILPKPLYKARIVSPDRPLPENIRMWFPEYDGDTFFASFKTTPITDNAQLESKQVLESVIRPVLEHLGFSYEDTTNLPFAVPTHSGIPLNSTKLPALAKRTCTGGADKPQFAQSSVPNSLPLPTADLHRVHTAEIRTSPEAIATTSGESIQGDESLPLWSIHDWGPFFCKVLEAAGDEAKYSQLKNTSPSFVNDIDQILKNLTGLSLSGVVHEIQHHESYYFYPQIHRSQEHEFSPGINRPLSLTIDHLGIRVFRRGSKSPHFVTGRVIKSYSVTNRVDLSQAAAAIKSTEEIAKLMDGISSDSGAIFIDPDWPVLLLLPTGEANMSLPELRYAYRTPAYIDWNGRHSLYVWLDAETGQILELVPLFGNAGGAARAKGNTFYRDPSLPSKDADFRFDPPPGTTGNPVPPFPLHITNELEGFNWIPTSGVSTPFIISPSLTFPAAGAEWDLILAGSLSTPTPTLEDPEKIDLFSTMFRYLDTIRNAPFSPLVGAFPASTLKVHVNRTCVQQDLARYDEDYEITLSVYHTGNSACTGSSETAKAFHDHTVAAHEMGHLLTLQQYGYLPSPAAARRQPDWCQPSLFASLSACPLPIRPSYVHDFADAWVHLFEQTNCVAGWMGRWRSFGDASLACVKHNEGSDWPRLTQVPDPVRFNYLATPSYLSSFDANIWDPSFAQEIGDHFPEHRKITSGRTEYADMQIAAAALWDVQEGRRSFERSIFSELFYFTRFVRALGTTGWLGTESLDNLCPPPPADDPNPQYDPNDPTCKRPKNAFSDRDVYRGLVDLEVKLANQWRIDLSDGTSAMDRTINKVASGFARAGIFMIPVACIDNNSSNNPPFCISGDSGGDAVIDVNDNDCSDDWIADGSGNPCEPASIRGVLHQDRDYLTPGLPVPGFHVWTGPRYTFSGKDVDLATSPLCNNTFKVELSDDETFSSILVDSGWLQTSTLRPCYCNWTLTQADWSKILEKLQAGGNNQLYYRLVTCRTPPGSGSPCIYSIYNLFTDTRIEMPGWAATNIRRSLSPANGLFGTVSPPFAIVTFCKTDVACEWRIKRDSIPQEYRLWTPKPKLGPPAPPDPAHQPIQLGKVPVQ